MKIIIFIFWGISLLSGVTAQDQITIVGRTIGLSSTGPGYWLFQDQSDTIAALEYSDFKNLFNKIKSQELMIERLDSLNAALNRVINAYEAYELAADENIQVQQEMITISDSLYLGYKELSQKLEKLSGRKALAIVGGAGAYRLDQNGPAYLLNVGLEYRKVQVCGVFGSDYKGLNLQYRVPIIFRK